MPSDVGNTKRDGQKYRENDNDSDYENAHCHDLLNQCKDIKKLKKEENKNKFIIYIKQENNDHNIGLEKNQYL